MKSILEKILRWQARKIISKYHPKIIAIAGSYGKTSTRHAIATLLRKKFNVRTPMKRDYNTEIGIPLVIIGAEDQGRSRIGWLKVFWQAEKQIIFKSKSYPSHLVLEYSVEYPDDMSKLCAIAKPEVVVFTGITSVHVEFFGSLEKLINEKAKILECMSKDGLAIFNADDAEAVKLKDRTSAQVLTYGFAGADVSASNIELRTRDDFSFEPDEKFSSLSYTVKFKDNVAEAKRDNVLGKGSVLSSLAAIAVADHFEIGLEDAIKSLNEIPMSPGRLRPLPGIKGSLIIDDSYNSSPAAVAVAIETLCAFSVAEGARRIAVIGKMAELGDFTESEHRKIGKKIAAMRVDFLVSVGEEAKLAAEEAIKNGFRKENIKHFNSPVEAGRWLDGEIRKGDIVLIKGSQSARMEKVVKDVMAEPLRAKQLLVRQYGKWLND